MMERKRELTTTTTLSPQASPNLLELCRLLDERILHAPSTPAAAALAEESVRRLFASRSRLTEVDLKEGAAVKPFMGLPVVVDNDLPPNTAEIRNHKGERIRIINLGET